ncbi:MAG: methyltransferase [Polyangiaceae bacterium]
MKLDTPEAIEEVATSYLVGCVLHAAADLGLFDVLAKRSATAQELARELDASLDGVERLVRACDLLGLVERRGDQIVGGPTILALAGDLGAVLRHHGRQVLPPMSRLARAVREGRPQHVAWPFASEAPRREPYAELALHPAEVETFLTAMDHASRGVGSGIASACDLSSARLLCDFGCGGGVVARELLFALPLLRVDSYDFAAACDVAEERSRMASLSDRHRFIRHDIREDAGARGADAVLLSAVLADLSLSDRHRVVAHARSALGSGGMLLVSETLLDDDRRGPLGPALVSLVLFAALGGEQLSPRELEELLVLHGFERPTRLRAGSRDLLVARAI